MAEKYRAKMFHRINHEQVKKVITFWVSSKKAARDKFRGLCKADSSINEAVLFRARDGKLIDEYTGHT